MRSVLRSLVYAVLTIGPLWAQPQETNAASPSFEVASIKLNRSGRQIVEFNIQPGGRFVATGITLGLLLQIAYNVKEFQIKEEPPWFDNERYDIEAKPDQAFSSSIPNLPAGEASRQITKMLQSLLAERCKLVIQHEAREHSAYALVVAKNGPKLKVSEKADPPIGGIWVHGRGYLTAKGSEMSAFADSLSRFLVGTVVNQTGLDGFYDFALQWTPSEGESGFAPRTYAEGDAGPAPDPPGPSLFSALQEQLGLKLERQKAAVDVLVIKHVERPSQN